MITIQGKEGEWVRVPAADITYWHAPILADADGCYFLLPDGRRVGLHGVSLAEGAEARIRLSSMAELEGLIRVVPDPTMPRDEAVLRSHDATVRAVNIAGDPAREALLKECTSPIPAVRALAASMALDRGYIDRDTFRNMLRIEAHEELRHELINSVCYLRDCTIDLEERRQ